MRRLMYAMLMLPVATPAECQEQRMPTEAEIAAAMALATPGPEHARLAGLAGTWDQEIKFAIGPGTTSTVRGVAENRLILGGRFLYSESKTLEPVMGQIIESVGIYGFDRRGGTWTVLGLDSFGTYYVEAEGAAAQDAQSIVMPGVEIDPRTKKEEKYDMILQFIDADTYLSAIVFKFAGGVESRAVEITHRRRR